MDQSSWWDSLTDEISGFFAPIGDGIGAAWDFVAYYVGLAWDWLMDFLALWPMWAIFLLLLALFLAVIGILASHGLAIWRARTAWKPMEGHLTFSYFCGTGQHQRRLIYKEAHHLLRDWKWSWVSAAGLAYRLGNLKPPALLWTALSSVAYLPLALLGIVEMAFRIIIGTVWLLAASLVQRIVLILLNWVSLLMIPLARMLDRSSRVEQYCYKCFKQFDLPDFVCPCCQNTISRLRPGRAGVLIARCQCGKLLSTSTYTGRSRLAAECPSCGTELIGGNAKQLTVIVIGGNSSGKTALIAAFQHEYLNSQYAQPLGSLFGFPADSFADLEQNYTSGEVEASDASAAQMYQIGRKTSGVVRDAMVMCDIPDEVILQDTWEKNPLNLAYADGIVLVVDPLSVRSVRAEHESVGGATAGYSTDDATDLLASFVNQYLSIIGRSAKRSVNVPVAVVLTKADLKVVRRKIGPSIIAARYNQNPAQWGGDPERAASDMCRDYLADIGLGNTLANIDKAFSVVRYFSVSAKGTADDQDTSFNPVGVLTPFTWLAERAHSGLAPTLLRAQERTRQ